MAKTKLTIESDFGTVFTGLDDVSSKLGETQQVAKASGNAMSGAFNDAIGKSKKLGDNIKKGGDEIKTSVQRFNEQNGVINKLIEKERQLTVARNKSNSGELIKKYNKLIEETQRKMKDLTAAQKEVAKTSPFDSLKTGIASVFGGNLLFTAVNGVKQIFQDMIGNNVRLQKSIQNLSAITGASGSDLEFYGNEAQKMGQKIEGGAVAAVEAFKLIGSAKPELLKNKEGLVEVTEAAVTLAQASGLTLPEAAQNLGNALNAFSADASDANKFINVLASSAQLGAKEIPFITEALTKFGGVAKQANVSIEQSAAAIEILGAKIPEASIVGTNLRGVLIKLQTVAASEKREFQGLSKELELLAPKVKDVTFLKAKFGEENLLAIQTLIAERKELDKMTKSVEGTSAAFEQAATNTDTMAQSILEAGNAYDAFLTALGNGKLSSIFKGITDGATVTFQNLAALLNGTLIDQENIKAIVGFGNATQKQAEQLVKLGLTISNLNKLSEGEQGIVNFLKGTDLYLTAIKDKTTGESVLKGFADESRKLVSLYSQGAIGIEEYTIKLKILQIQTNKAVESQKKFNGSAGDPGGIHETIGLIEALEAKIQDLTTARKSSTDAKTIFGLNDQIKAAQKELDLLLGRGAEQIKKAQDEFDKAILDLNKRANAAALKALSGEERIEAEKKFQLEEVDLLQAHIEKLGKALNKNFAFTLDQQESFNVLRLEAERKAAYDLIQLEIDKQAKINEQQKKSNDQTIQSLKNQQDAEENAVGATNKPSGLSRSYFEELKQRQILNIQEKYAIKQFELKKKQLRDEEQLDVDALQKKIDLLKGKNDTESIAKREAFEKDLEILKNQYKIENEEILNQTDGILNDIKAKRDELNRKPFSLREFFGLEENDVSNLRTAFAELNSLIDNVYQDNIKRQEKEIQSSQEKISQYDSEIAALQNKLNNETSLNEEGKANNIDIINQLIAAKEEEKRKEKEIQDKALEEKKRLQKQQLLIDSITQASNLFVAASNILSTTARDPISLGIALATIGVMIGGFVYSKVQATKAINESNNFAEGVIGLDGPGTETSDDIRANLSKGESVITAKKTRQNRRLLEGIHEDDKDQMKLGILDLIRNQGIRLEDDLPESLNVKKEIVRQSEINAYLKTDNSRMEKELSQVKGILNEILDENKLRMFHDSKGNEIIKRGSHTIINKRNG